jgi:autotransporter adhesin
VEIKFDTKPTSGSKNAVTSGGLHDILYTNSVSIGRSASAGSYGVCLGDGARGTTGGIALGKDAKANGGNSVALGPFTSTSKTQTVVIGSNVSLKDEGCAVIGAWNEASTQVVQLYLINAGTPLANTYEEGAACLGYVVKDKNGNISECGTRKLSELLTNNTAFAPAALDLDAPAPTPFLPTGIMDPIELPENLTE